MMDKIEIVPISLVLVDEKDYNENNQQEVS